MPREKVDTATVSRRRLVARASAVAGAGLLPNASRSAEPGAPCQGQASVRTVAPPTTISPAAQAYLRRGAGLAPTPPPPPGDAAGWRAYVRAKDASFPAATILRLPGASVETRRAGEATYHLAKSDKLAATEGLKAHLHIHGGGWVLFGGQAAMAFAKLEAMRSGGLVYGADYRMPPDHPFPAGLDDCLAIYREVLTRHSPRDILVSGGSAGGNLAAALMLKAREVGLPKPCALVLDSPVTDLTNAGDSWSVLEGLDPVLNDVGGVGSTQLYLNGRDPRDPHLSPLFGHLGPAFPPTYLRTGTRDRLLSDTVRLHAALRAAGVPADLYVAEAMPHAGFGGLTPEDAAAAADRRRWLSTRWPANEAPPS